MLRCCAPMRRAFSNAILEAMAMGLPVVATDVDGNAETVLGGVTGILVPARDPKTLSEELLKLAGHKDRMRKTGEEGQRRAPIL